jgi:hypothetical protein
MNCARIAIAVIRRSTDHNQAAIVEALRKAGYHVTDLSGVGQGCPDLLCAKPGSVCLVEVKNKEGRNRFTPAQVDYFASTSCPIYVIRSVNEVINLINGQIEAINGGKASNFIQGCRDTRGDTSR